MSTPEEKAKKLKKFIQNPDLAMMEEVSSMAASLDNLNNKVIPVELHGAEIVTIKGKKGDKGDKGDVGPQGESIQGDKGEKGDPGQDAHKVGPAGPKGPKGNNGKDGVDGVDGQDGIDGAAGKDGVNGSPDSPQQIRDKIASLKKDDRLDIGALKGADQLRDQISQHAVGEAKRGVLYAGLMRSGGGHTIQDEGVALTQRTKLNFVGAGVAATDDAANDTTIVTISSGGGSGSGATGPTGATGPQGSQGSIGSIGVQGTQGSQGSLGATGAQGATGNQGTQGTPGTQGSLGPTGATGPQGPQGTQGSIGIQGPQGTQGSIGVQGTQGSIGIQGPQGTQGSQGSLGATGATGPSGTQYPWRGAWAVGTVYVLNDTVQNNGNGYVSISGNTATGNNNPTSGGSASTFWDLLVQRGSQGSQGSAGATGAQGATGNQGTQGSIGVQGTQGTQGTQGSLGPTGATGPQGTQGSIGSIGVQGATGPTGGTGFVSPRSSATGSTLSPTPNADTTDVYILTAQAGTAAFQATSGTPVEGQKLIVKITGTGATRNVTWTGGTGGYTAGGVVMPLTVSVSKVVTVGFIYDTSNSINRWMCVAVSTQI